MLHVKSDQMLRLSEQRADAFSMQLARRAHARHPAATATFSLSALTTLMRNEVDAARAHGLRMRSELERWSDIACSVGFGFSSRLPWARALLTSGRLPIECLQMLEERAAIASRQR